jgi:hypothetical protein
MQPRTSPKTEASAERAQPGKRVSIAIGVAPLVALVAISVSLRPGLPAWGFMWALAAAIFFGLKWLSWWRARGEVAHSAGRSLAYLFLWPGMDAASFLGDARPAQPSGMR